MKKVLRKLFCYIGFHSFEISNLGSYRNCPRCGRRWVKRYDPMYGTTHWERYF